MKLASIVLGRHSGAARQVRYAITQRSNRLLQPGGIGLVNFQRAAKRHFEDAERLWQEGRTPNAGHLFGFHAECSIKALLTALGEPIDPNTGEFDRRTFKQHVNTLVNMALTLPLQAAGPLGSRYISQLQLLGAYRSWDVAHRYWDDRQLSAVQIANWRDSSREIQQMIDQARLDGVIQ